MSIEVTVRDTETGVSVTQTIENDVIVVTAAPATYTGRNEHGEYLVTVFPADGNKPASAEVAFRPDQWQTWGAPVLLSAVVGSVA